MLRAWVYPDACALDLLSAELAAPLVAIAQGTNVHSYLHMPLRRHLIVQALSRAAATITRSRDLATRLRHPGRRSTQVTDLAKAFESRVHAGLHQEWQG